MFGAPSGAVTLNRGGAVALRASSSVIDGRAGSLIGRTVRSSSPAAAGRGAFESQKAVMPPRSGVAFWLGIAGHLFNTEIARRGKTRRTHGCPIRMLFAMYVKYGSFGSMAIRVGGGRLA